MCAGVDDGIVAEDGSGIDGDAAAEGGVVPDYAAEVDVFVDLAVDDNGTRSACDRRVRTDSGVARDDGVPDDGTGFDDCVGKDDRVRDDRVRLNRDVVTERGATADGRVGTQ